MKGACVKERGASRGVHFTLESSFCEIVASCDSEERRRHPSDVHEAEEQQLRF